MYDTSVDISDGLWFDNGTIAHDDLLYYPDKYIVYNNTVRGCICKIEHCYRKCCARNQIYDEASRSCIDVIKVNLTDDEKELMRHIFREFDLLEELHGLTQVNGQQGLNKCDNTSCVFRTDSYKAHHISEVDTTVCEKNIAAVFVITAGLYRKKEPIQGTTKIIEPKRSYIVEEHEAAHIIRWEDGDLIVNSVEGYDSKIDVDSYCIDVMIYFNERTQSRTASPWTHLNRLPELNAGSFPTFSCDADEFHISNVEQTTMRVFVGKPLTFIKEERRKTFLNYSLYGFGVPAALTVLLALLEFAPIEDSKYLPRLRKRECLISVVRVGKVWGCVNVKNVRECGGVVMCASMGVEVLLCKRNHGSFWSKRASHSTLLTIVGVPVDHSPLSLHQPNLPCTRYSMPFQDSRNTLVTLSGLRVSMGSWL
ncbi:hypothetical protein EVAR_21816_1 [Eumeta japonica]|uniref:Methuselah N-terminal domain-containing protein n=1 Tax=Eumeta variegata TaxID=151549 RepID=A0A4C1S9G1_EUMVA|nr:hypothetical protein EVAR_21816_1 [Eumeta japonica]